MIVFTIFGFLLVVYFFLRLKADIRPAIPVRPSLRKDHVEMAEFEKRIEMGVDSGLCKVVRRTMPVSPLLSQLGASTQQFFKNYPELQIVGVGFVLSSYELVPSSYAANGISIGHRDECDFVQRADDDSVYVFYGGEEDIEDVERISSIYDLILQELGLAASSDEGN